ncbi:MAG: DUF2281 domain-containing protein [Bryobacteraceae bacterium]
MSKREQIVQEIAHLPEPDLDRLLAFLQYLKRDHSERMEPALAAESALAKDWLSGEEDAAWADL